jgi:hypothetical protein
MTTKLIAGVSLLMIAFTGGGPLVQAQGRVPSYVPDPSWPKPLPIEKDADGIPRQWVIGQPGGICIDNQQRIITTNRAHESGGVTETRTAMAAAPITIFDSAGNLVKHFGDRALVKPDGPTKSMPQGAHGCYVDHENNLWIGGYQDGVVQKWSLDGKMLLQIGTKGVCDGPSMGKGHYPTCVSPGNNSSQTLLNNPADIAVDPNPDPVTGQRGSVYIADGYGNFRVVVFDAHGKFLRQMGSRGNGPGQFGSPEGNGGSGHPHCVLLGTDNLVYACDRTNARIHVFERTGKLVRTIVVTPPEFMGKTISNQVVTDLAFDASDPKQTYLLVSDLDSARIWIVEKASGKVVGGFGRPGHQVGDFHFPHQIVTDSRGDLYISETSNGRRLQKYRKQ